MTHLSEEDPLLMGRKSQFMVDQQRMQLGNPFFFPPCFLSPFSPTPCSSLPPSLLFFFPPSLSLLFSSPFSLSFSYLFLSPYLPGLFLWNWKKVSHLQSQGPQRTQTVQSTHPTPSTPQHYLCCLPPGHRSIPDGINKAPVKADKGYPEALSGLGQEARSRDRQISEALLLFPYSSSSLSCRDLCLVRRMRQKTKTDTIY